MNESHSSSAALSSAAAPSGPARESRALPVSFIWAVVAALTFAAWLASRARLYTPGSDFGYNLGLAGGVMMLLLFLYPLRKHFSWLQKIGSLRYWFWLHMLLGITGPMLIIFHSTFTVGSLNAGVALFSMILVAGSGIIGRFIYTKVHHGLYGRNATVQERQVRLGLASGEVKSKFHFVPALEARLRAFESFATSEAPSFVQEVKRFLTVGLQARWISLSGGRELARALATHAAAQNWDAAKLARRVHAGRRLLRGYLDSLQDVAQFRTYERMFAAWHVLHVPLVYLLIVSAIVHVIAVHMY